MAEEAEAVLLIEDNPDEVAFFTHAFAKLGRAARLLPICDGAAALEFIFGADPLVLPQHGSRPKLIILDLKLPKVSGLDVLRRLKADVRTRTIPVVSFSSSQEERDLISSYSLGANSYLVKPMDFDQFDATVRALCQYWLQFNQTPKP